MLRKTLTAALVGAILGLGCSLPAGGSDLGEHHEGDAVGGPGTPSHINNTPRGPKGSPAKRGGGRDDGPARTPATETTPNYAQMMAEQVQQFIADLGVAVAESRAAGVPPTQLANIVGGIGIITDLAQQNMDRQTLAEVMRKIDDYRLLHLQPGQSARVVVQQLSNGDIVVSPADADRMSDGHDKSWAGTIARPTDLSPNQPMTEWEARKILEDGAQTLPDAVKQAIQAYLARLQGIRDQAARDTQARSAAEKAVRRERKSSGNCKKGCTRE